MYSIIRTKKHKSIGQLRTREGHSYRTRPTPNADPEKLHRNKVLFGEKDYAKKLEDVLADYSASGKHIRKDAVLAIEYLLTASPEFFDAGPKHERNARLKDWCAAQVDFMKKEHGAENILCMHLHLDEKTPHIECFIVPIDKKGKLNCKSFLGARNSLSILQTRYAEHNKSFGLQRGANGSKATHQKVKQFYDHINQPSKVGNESLKVAVKLDPPTIKDRIDPTGYTKTQEAKLANRISKLFESTVYENKLIKQASQILRQWSRWEKNAKLMQYKMESEKKALEEKLANQTKAIKDAEKLRGENQRIRADLDNALVSNNLLMDRLRKNKLTS